MFFSTNKRMQVTEVRVRAGLALPCHWAGNHCRWAAQTDLSTVSLEKKKLENGANAFAFVARKSSRSIIIIRASTKKQNKNKTEKAP